MLDRPGKFREPDVVLMLAQHSANKGEEYWTGADLVVEVVSDYADSRLRDLEKKPLDYAEAGIPEYWIVDPAQRCVIMLTLHRGAYIEHGRFAGGTMATSALLDNFSVAVDEVLESGK